MIYNILKKYKYDVKFKPHPQDDGKYPVKTFGKDVIGDLRGEIKKGSIFIGFVSSALYEAKMHGLPVLGLDTRNLSYKRSFDVSKSFSLSGYNRIPEYIESMTVDFNINVETESLSERFNSAMNGI